MRDIHRYAMVFAVLALASLAIAGCNTPTPVDPGDQAPALYTEETPCPTLNQICISITNHIESTCPRTFPPKNWGEENSCRKTLMAQLLDSYKDCLSGDQLSEVRDCVAMQLGLPDAGDNKEPDPYEF